MELFDQSSQALPRIDRPLDRRMRTQSATDRVVAGLSCRQNGAKSNPLQKYWRTERKSCLPNFPHSIETE